MCNVLCSYKVAITQQSLVMDTVHKEKFITCTQYIEITCNINFIIIIITEIYHGSALLTYGALRSFVLLVVTANLLYIFNK